MTELPLCPISHFVLQSVDQLCHIASFLAIDELLCASSLSRSLHSLFDSEAVWLGRLRSAKLLQRIPGHSGQWRMDG